MKANSFLLSSCYRLLLLTAGDSWLSTKCVRGSVKRAVVFSYSPTSCPECLVSPRHYPRVGSPEVRILHPNRVRHTSTEFGFTARLQTLRYFRRRPASSISHTLAADRVATTLTGTSSSVLVWLRSSSVFCLFWRGALGPGLYASATLRSVLLVSAAPSPIDAPSMSRRTLPGPCPASVLPDLVRDCPSRRHWRITVDRSVPYLADLDLLLGHRKTMSVGWRRPRTGQAN